ncbi:MAG: hypothetical protein NTV34_15345 [Proteobacteria bacterium]|nr:hypothetical protein [Pseudomonadota bacterium]
MAKPEDADIIGVGALTVWDLARTDVPIPIQTEDLVELFADGTFKLLGRVEHSPLKGCSLNVTEVVSGTRSPEKPHKVQNADPDATAPLALISLEEIKIGLAERSEKSLSWLLNLSKDPVFLERLSLELGSKNLAESALADFHSGLPKTAVVLGESAIRSLGSQKTLPLKWLVIPPSTHSVASIHVLAICFALGLDIDARDTNIIGALSLGSALSQALATAKRQKLIAKIHPGIWRLSPNISETRSFLVFGDNETVATLSKMTRGKTIGFENALACTWSTSADLKEPQALRQLVKDNVALAQRGCMSARMNFIEGPLDIKTFERIQELIVESLSDYSVTQESTGIKKHARSTARSLEVVRLRQLGALVGGDLGLASGRSGAGGWTTAIVSAPDDPSRFLSRLDLTFIFIINTKNTPHIPSPRDLPGLKLIAASNSLAPFKVLTKDPHIGKDATLPEIDQRIRLVKLGELNCPALTGLHLDRAIFADLHESRVK